MVGRPRRSRESRKEVGQGPQRQRLCVGRRRLRAKHRVFVNMKRLKGYETLYQLWSIGRQSYQPGFTARWDPVFTSPKQEVAVYTGKDRRLGCGNRADVAYTQTGTWTRHPCTARCACPEVTQHSMVCFVPSCSTQRSEVIQHSKACLLSPSYSTHYYASRYSAAMTNFGAHRAHHKSGWTLVQGLHFNLHISKSPPNHSGTATTWEEVGSWC